MYHQETIMYILPLKSNPNAVRIPTHVLWVPFSHKSSLNTLSKSLGETDNFSVCLVCCVLDSVCKLFGETIRNMLGRGCCFVVECYVTQFVGDNIDLNIVLSTGAFHLI